MAALWAQALPGSTGEWSWESMQNFLFCSKLPSWVWSAWVVSNQLQATLCGTPAPSSALGGAGLESFVCLTLTWPRPLLPGPSRPVQQQLECRDPRGSLQGGAG